MTTLNTAYQYTTSRRMLNTLTDGLFQKIHSSTAMLAVVNGMVGDYLAAAKHPLAIPMHLYLKGQSLPMDKPVMFSPLPGVSGKLIILVHGLCMTGSPWAEQLMRMDQQEKAARQYSLMGYTPVCLSYNSGRHISTNGQEFASQLESLVKRWSVPVQELVIVGFSMGGLVSRSACHYGALAGHRWLHYLTKIVFIATPHHGSPLERRGNWIDRALSMNRVTAPLARLGKIRSAGITDLRYGNLLDSDWEGRDRFEDHADRRLPVALPAGVQCYAIAATHGKRAGDWGDRFLGDGLVPLDSALGRHENPAHCLQFSPLNQWIGYGMSHLELLGHSDIHAQIKTWLTTQSGSGQRKPPLLKSPPTSAANSPATCSADQSPHSCLPAQTVATSRSPRVTGGTADQKCRSLPQAGQRVDRTVSGLAHPATASRTGQGY